MSKEYYEKLLKQLAVDYNCDPSDFRAEKHIITIPKWNEGRRNYSPDIFFQMVTCGVNALFMADERLHDFLREWSKDVEGHHLFEYESLPALDAELKKYGYQLDPTHHMFIPCREVTVEERFRVKWLYDDEINPFYGDQRFPNAIAYPKPCPARPDRIVAIAYDGDNIMGMAGCSEDAPHWQQIGIDVMPEYRSKGVGSYLVTLLKNKIIEMGDVPFYGTGAANTHSQNIAIKCGFKPAWVETEASKIESEKSE